jgi:hypothetical protein
VKNRLRRLARIRTPRLTRIRTPRLTRRHLQRPAETGRLKDGRTAKISMDVDLTSDVRTIEEARSFRIWEETAKGYHRATQRQGVSWNDVFSQF